MNSLTEEKEKKKKIVFRKIEEGMVLESEDGEALAFGLPSEVELMTSGEGKGGVTWKGIGGEVKGEKYSKVKYDWTVIQKTEKKITKEQINDFKESITTGSGTVAITMATAQYTEQIKFCEKCNTTNPQEAKYCLNCGSKISYLRGNRI